MDADDQPAAPWTRHGKVRARLEQDGALEIVINPKLKDKVSAEAMKLYESKLADIKSGKFTVPFNDK